MSGDAARNLLQFIYEETKNLTSPKMTAGTFSSIAYLMRNGAKLPSQQTYTPRFAQPTFFEAPHAPLSTSVIPTEVEESQTTNIGDEENIPMPQEENKPYVIPPSKLTEQPVPNDWTKPKIFRAGDL